MAPAGESPPPAEPPVLLPGDRPRPSGAEAPELPSLSGIRVAASDMDGTFLGPDHEAPAANMSVLRELEAAGIPLVFCTGRNRAAAQARLPDLDLSRRPGIFLNGAVVYGKAGSIIHERTVPRDIVADALRFVRERRDRCGIVVCHGDVHFTPDRAEKWNVHLHKTYEDPDPVSLGGYDAAIADFDAAGDGDAATAKGPAAKKRRREDAHLMHVTGSPADLDDVRESLESMCAGRVKVLRSLPTCTTLLHPLCSKADGLRPVLKELGRSMEEAIAFGDAENDIEMLQAVRVGVAMGNAMSKVKESVDWQCAANGAEPPGVARVLREVLRLARG